jgi:phenylalanyl-tRNA synthetase alpha chain
MKETVEALLAEIENFTIGDIKDLENFRNLFISKKGKTAELFELLKTAPIEEKKQIGALVNQVKNASQVKFDDFQEKLNNSTKTVKPEFDLSLPSILNMQGSQHPLNIVKGRIIEIFERMGFSVADGPEIEKDWYNFSALNFADNHPAREMQDTFFIAKSDTEVKEDMLLRTHTSNVQIRLMEHNQPPLRSIMPGRVYRNEAISARAHCYFHQVEAIYIDQNVSFKDLKDTLYHFAKEMFGPETKVRYRPSYFPFTEPSAEIDITCFICKGEGCNVCKHSGWVEIAGSGMVDSNVLENVGIDSSKYSGFALGMGIERITMLKYQINDLRLFTENDVRFLRQFSGL